MMNFQLMSVDHLIKLLNKFGFDQIIWKAREDFDKLCDSFPVVSKLCEVLINKESKENNFFSWKWHVLFVVLFCRDRDFICVWSDLINQPIRNFIGWIQEHFPHPNFFLTSNLLLNIMLSKHTKLKLKITYLNSFQTFPTVCVCCFF